MDVSVYLITNLINGKRYVGVTSRPLHVRKREHEYISKIKSSPCHQALHAALSKYGFSRFSTEVIERCESVPDAHAAERYWIEWYGTYGSVGYNETRGGEGVPGVRHSEEQRRAWSIGRKGKMSGAKHPMFGKKHTDEALAKIRAGRKNRKPDSAETREKLSLAAKRQWERVRAERAH